MYLSNRNALRIDAFRQLIDEWKEHELISELEYFYLIASVVEAVPFVSNIAGTYGAYLKTWDKRTQKRIIPIPFPILSNNKKNKMNEKNPKGAGRKKGINFNKYYWSDPLTHEVLTAINEKRKLKEITDKKLNTILKIIN
jgi:adenine-specific DNA methylase